MQIIVFFLLGPLAVFATTFWAGLDPSRLKPEITLVIAMIAFMISYPISALLGIIDACLALVMSKFLKAPLVAAAGAIFLRAPLTAAAGAIVVHGPLAYQLYGSELRFWTVAVAAYAGVCSLLSTNWLAMRRTEEPEGPAPGP